MHSIYTNELLLSVFTIKIYDLVVKKKCLNDMFLLSNQNIFKHVLVAYKNGNETTLHFISTANENSS